MTTAAERKAAKEAAAAEAEQAKADQQTESANANAPEDDDRSDHIGSDSNVDGGQPVEGGIAQPEVAPRATVADAQGVNRIVISGVQDGWTPAPVEPDAKAVEAAKERERKREEAEEARREGRIDPVSGELLSKDEWLARQKDGDEK